MTLPYRAQRISERVADSSKFGAVVQLSLTMRFAHFAALMQAAAHVYRSPRLQCESAILPSHHTDFISHPGTACIREDAGRPLPTHGSDTITTGQKASHLYSQ